MPKKISIVFTVTPKVRFGVTKAVASEASKSGNTATFRIKPKTLGQAIKVWEKISKAFPITQKGAK